MRAYLEPRPEWPGYFADPAVVESKGDGIETRVTIPRFHAKAYLEVPEITISDVSIQEYLEISALVERIQNPSTTVQSSGFASDYMISNYEYGIGDANG